MSAAPIASHGSQTPLATQSRINDALKDSPHCLGTGVVGTLDDGIVILQGSVKTFYHKQVAQELLRKLDGVERIVNLLEVQWHQPGTSE